MKLKNLDNVGLKIDRYTAIYNDDDEGREKTLLFLKEYLKYNKQSFCLYRGCLSLCAYTFNDSMFFIPECEDFAWVSLDELIDNCDILIGGVSLMYHQPIDTGCETALRVILNYVGDDGSLSFFLNYKNRSDGNEWRAVSYVTPELVFTMRPPKNLLYKIEDRLHKQIADCVPTNPRIPCVLDEKKMFVTTYNKIKLTVNRIKVDNGRWQVEITVGKGNAFWVDFRLPRFVYDKFGNKIDHNGEVIEENEED